MNPPDNEIQIYGSSSGHAANLPIYHRKVERHEGGRLASMRYLTVNEIHRPPVGNRSS